MNNQKIRVLLVDDHPVVRNGVRLMLMGPGDIDVTGEAETAQEGLTLIREQDFDVAVVDIAMAGKNGLELLKLIKAEKPKLAVLMLSMYSEDVYAVRALRLGAAGYLTKTSPAATIVSAVRRAASGGKCISPEVVEKVANMVGGNMSAHEALSDREFEVLRLIVSGSRLTEIARTLHLSPKTVTTHRGRILEKIGVGSNVELARYALKNGLFEATTPLVNEEDFFQL